jgi:hypothetical protein
MRYDAIWINNVFLGIVYKKGSFIPLGIKFCSTKRHPITLGSERRSLQPLIETSVHHLLSIYLCTKAYQYTIYISCLS